MCKKCEEYLNNDRLVTIKNKPIKFGQFANGLTLDLYICEGKLSADLVDIGNNTIATNSVKIKYCPFCGEKLS